MGHIYKHLKHYYDILNDNSIDDDYYLFLLELFLIVFWNHLDKLKLYDFIKLFYELQYQSEKLKLYMNFHIFLKRKF